MRRLVFIISSILFSLTVNSQDLSVDELLTLTSLSSQKFDQYISKKGFTKSSSGFQHDSLAQTWQPKQNNKKKKEQIQRQVERSQVRRMNMLHFKTSCPKEFGTIRTKLKKEGFQCPADTLVNCSFPLRFKRKNITVNVDRLIENEDTLFSFRFNEKLPPAPAKIEFANDLLQFESHEDLIYIFGENNVKKDKYYFSDNDARVCTVLFPYSSRQVVFLWKDDSTCSELASIVFGGTLGISSDISYTSQVAANTWMLSNGISCNLNLRELIQMNGGDLRFYGKQSKYFLSLVPENTGQLELNEGISVVLGCLNCENDTVLNAATVSAKDALQKGLGMHVLMVILSPESKVRAVEVSR